MCLGLGFISTFVTVLTGYLAQETFPHGETIHRMMGTHRTLGFIILGFGVLLMIWSFLKREGIPKGSKFFLFLFGFTVLMILQNADLGGRMVFVEGAAVKALPVPQENRYEHGGSEQGDHHGDGETEGEDSGHHHGDDGQHLHHHEEE
jgi:uncharacterized membrane protein